MDRAVHQYLAEIGRRGGQKSRRKLSADEARAMVKVREARRAFQRFRVSCFWSFDPNFRVTADDVQFVATELMKHGNREAWLVGARLCR